jgi:signal transduction histidine kinase
VHEKVQPYLVLEAITKSLADSIGEKNLRVLNRLPVEYSFEMDMHLLRHVLRNLLTNAIKYSNPGGEIVVELISGEPVEISVTDQGVGMNPHQLAAVLGREKSVSTAGTAGEKGSGLGLAICREMLKSQGGDLLVTSKPGKGSTFTIRLPR